MMETDKPRADGRVTEHRNYAVWTVGYTDQTIVCGYHEPPFCKAMNEVDAQWIADRLNFAATLEHLARGVATKRKNASRDMQAFLDNHPNGLRRM